MAAAKNGGITVVDIRDLNNQVMPMGTSIKATTDVGTIENPSNYIVPNTNEPETVKFRITPEASLTTAKSGFLVIEVKSPSGITKYLDFEIMQN